MSGPFVVLAVCLSIGRPARAQVCAQSQVQCDCGVWIPCSGRSAAEISGACAEACASATSGSGGGARAGGGGASMEQLQLNTAYNAGAALGGAFIQWLLTPERKVGDPRAAMQAQENRLRQGARLRSDKLHDREATEVVSEFKDAGPDTADLPEKRAEVEPTLEGLKHEVRTLDCALDEFFRTAAALGPDAVARAEQVRKDLLARERELPSIQGMAVIGTDDMGTEKKTAYQLATQMHFYRDPLSGGLHIDVMYHASKNGMKPVEGQNVVNLDRWGGIECMEATPAAAKCMREFDPHAKKTWCPKSPPESKSAPKTEPGVGNQMKED